MKLTQPELGTLRGFLLYPLQQHWEVGLLLVLWMRTLRLREAS